MDGDVEGNSVANDWWQFVRDAARFIRALEAGRADGESASPIDDLVRSGSDAEVGSTCPFER